MLPHVLQPAGREQDEGSPRCGADALVGVQGVFGDVDQRAGVGGDGLGDGGGIAPDGALDVIGPFEDVKTLIFAMVDVQRRPVLGEGLDLDDGKLRSVCLKLS